VRFLVLKKGFFITISTQDLARMTETELEKVRTAIVIKTYAAIIRYGHFSVCVAESMGELVRVMTVLW